MFKVDFWNNPIVVSAFRLKYRRSAPTLVTCLWLVGLLTLGALLHRYQARLPIPWARIYLVAIIGLQFIITAIYSLSATYSALRAEVMQRTLDFQRIAALSPRQILLGKLLGEPAHSYLLAIATVPLAVTCSALGAVSLPVLFGIYVTLITTGLMCGVLGLIQPLEIDATKPNSSSTGSGVAIFGLMLLFFLPAAAANASHLAGNPFTGLLFGCFIPIFPVYEVAIGQPGTYGLTLWGASVPYLVVAPLAQLGLAAVCFATMVRRMVYPLNPPLSKWQSYALLLAVDALAAGLLFEPSPLPGSLPIVVAKFCLFHLAASLMLIRCVTPWREVLLSWIWRFRGRVSWARDSLLGNRAENSLALAVFCAIGAFSLVLMVWLPALLQGQPDAASGEALVQSGPMLIGTAVLIVSLGVLYQWFTLIAGRHGWIAFALLVAVLVVVPAMVGQFYAEYLPRETGRQYVQQSELAYSFSAASHFARWITDPLDPRPVAPMVGAFGTLLVAGWVLVRRRIGLHVAVVQRKLAAMGVEQASGG